MVWPRTAMLAVLAVLVATATGCGSDPETEDTTTPSPGVAGAPNSEIDVMVAPGFAAGKRVVAGSGCLACHRIGASGNNGPGPDLAEIGARLSPAALADAVTAGPGIMPSYEGLKQDRPREFREMIEFLSALRGGPS